MQEERFSQGENSNRMVTVTPFNANLKVHIKQFYVNENGEMKPSTLSVEEYNELVKLIPKIQDSIAQYELQDIGRSPSLPLPVLPPPLISSLNYPIYQSGRGLGSRLFNIVKSVDAPLLKEIILLTVKAEAGQVIKDITSGVGVKNALNVVPNVLENQF